MSDKVLIIKTKEDIEKIAFLAPLVAGAKAIGGAAMAGGRAVAGLATRAAQTPIGQKIGAAAKRVDDVANDPRAKAAAKAKEARDAHKQSQEMRAQEQLSGAKESADRARREAGIATGEPMNLAWRLLKNNRFHPEHEPMSSDDMIAYLDEEYLGHIGPKEVNPMENYQDIMADTPEGRKKQTNIMGRTYGGEPTFNMIPLAGEGQPMINPHAEIFRRSKPMEITFQLLKERVSPEAKRHKLEYDKKYESTPERVKYREELNRERKKRGIYGHGGPDMSHTKDHKIVPEDPHTNRARHFREMGTLL